jgi:hypothetical protein
MTDKICGYRFSSRFPLAEGINTEEMIPENVGI